MEIEKKTLRSIFLGCAGLILLYFLLHETGRILAVLRGLLDILSPFVAGAIMAFVLNVPMRAIERMLKDVRSRGLRRGLAMLLTFLAVILVIVGVVLLLLPQIAETTERLIATLPGFFQRVQEFVMKQLAEHPELLEWLKENTDFENLDWANLLQKAVDLVSKSITTIGETLFATVKNLSDGIFNAVLSIIFAIYCLGGKEVLARQGRRILYSFLPERVCDEIVRILRMSNVTFSSFISGQTVEAVILGCMFAIAMLIFGMPYVPLVSVVIAVTALVPIVGAFVGCIIGAFFIMVDNVVLAFWFVIMFLVLQQIENNLVYPKVVGTSIGLPGMWVLVAVTFGGGLMGIPGMLFMIPMASVLYALAREVTNKRLSGRGIERDKLQDHPPDMDNHPVKSGNRNGEKFSEKVKRIAHRGKRRK